MGEIESVDLQYGDGTNYLHIWQTTMSPEKLGTKDLVKGGETIAIGDIEWTADDLFVFNGVANGVQFSARLTDGRTVSIDSDLDVETMRAVIESLYLRPPP